LALLGRRIAAYMTDAAILFTVLAPTSFALQRLLQVNPETELAMWRAAIFGFSVPSWAYFILGDSSWAGATLGKRLWRVHVVERQGRRLSLGRAAGRTSVKLLPWEMVHLVFVAASGGAAASRVQMILIVAANLLVLVYLAVAVATRGRRSIHDLAAGTIVVPAAR
jgi:uncharacterized RDD family membrane protein YckC